MLTCLCRDKVHDSDGVRKDQKIALLQTIWSGDNDATMAATQHVRKAYLGWHQQRAGCFQLVIQDWLDQVLARSLHDIPHGVIFFRTILTLAGGMCSSKHASTSTNQC